MKSSFQLVAPAAVRLEGSSNDLMPLVLLSTSCMVLLSLRSLIEAIAILSG
jgi:hypothetical protein